MKITVYYEDKNHPTILEVPDRECEIWVEDDYQRRLAEAEDKTAVERRTAQEIMDEDYNKPTFNNNQAETRRHHPERQPSVPCRDEYRQEELGGMDGLRGRSIG